MIRENENVRHENFRVMCIRCGSKIRDDDHEDVSGLCLECFYQLLNEQLRTQKVSSNGDFVSER